MGILDYDSPIVFMSKNELKKANTKTMAHRASDSIRIIAIGILSVCLIVSVSDKIEDRRMDNVRIEIEERRAERNAMLASMTQDEKYVMMIERLGGSECQFSNITISEEDNAIYICIEDDGPVPEEVWNARKQFQLQMASLAVAGNVTKEIIVLGVIGDSVLWAIENGEVITNSIDLEGGDAIEL